MNQGPLIRSGGSLLLLTIALSLAAATDCARLIGVTHPRSVVLVGSASCPYCADMLLELHSLRDHDPSIVVSAILCSLGHSRGLTRAGEGVGEEIRDRLSGRFCE